MMSQSPPTILKTSTSTSSLFYKINAAYDLIFICLNQTDSFLNSILLAIATAIYLPFVPDNAENAETGQLFGSCV